MSLVFISKVDMDKMNEIMVIGSSAMDEIVNGKYGMTYYLLKRGDIGNGI